MLISVPVPVVMMVPAAAVMVMVTSPASVRTPRPRPPPVSVPRSRPSSSILSGSRSSSVLPLLGSPVVSFLGPSVSRLPVLVSVHQRPPVHLLLPGTHGGASAPAAAVLAGLRGGGLVAELAPHHGDLVAAAAVLGGVRVPAILPATSAAAGHGLHSLGLEVLLEGVVLGFIGEHLIVRLVRVRHVHVDVIIVDISALPIHLNLLYDIPS